MHDYPFVYKWFIALELRSMFVDMACCLALAMLINVYLLFSVLDLTACPEEQILNCNQPDMDDCVVCENPDEEVVAMSEEAILDRIVPF
jgi:hypothetical protein